MKKVNEVICPVCGNEVSVNLKYKYHKCLYCNRYIKLTLIKGKIRNVEENVEYTKKELI